MIRDRMPRRIALLLPLLLLGGCAPTNTGGVDTGKFTGAEKAVATTLDDLADAGQKRDGSRVCADLLSKRLVDKLDSGGGSCQTTLDDQLDDADVFTMDVAKDAITVNGNRATALVRSEFDGHKQPRTLHLVLEGRRWKLDGISR
jgi:hypothetical protein